MRNTVYDALGYICTYISPMYTHPLYIHIHFIRIHIYLDGIYVTQHARITALYIVWCTGVDATLSPLFIRTLCMRTRFHQRCICVTEYTRTQYTRTLHLCDTIHTFCTVWAALCTLYTQVCIYIHMQDTHLSHMYKHSCVCVHYIHIHIYIYTRSTRHKTHIDISCTVFVWCAGAVHTYTHSEQFGLRLGSCNSFPHTHTHTHTRTHIHTHTHTHTHTHYVHISGVCVHYVFVASVWHNTHVYTFCTVWAALGFMHLFPPMGWLRLVGSLKW